MNFNQIGTVRRLDLLLLATVVGSITLVPTLAVGQDTGQTPAAPPKTVTQDKKAADTTPGLRVIPIGTQANPATGTTTTQALPPGAKIQKGPDGKDQVIGADGKPLMGPDGKPYPVPTSGTGTTLTPGGSLYGGRFGGSRSSGFGGSQVGGSGIGNQGRSPFSNLSNGGTIAMDFRGTDIQNVLKFFSMATNWQIIPDAGLTGPVTIISPKQLTIDQAFQVLQATLEIRGYSGQLDKKSDPVILRIVPIDRAAQSTTFVGGPGADGGGLTPQQIKDAHGQVITQVIPIDNVDAGSLSRELKELVNKGASLVASTGTNALIVTDTASNVQRISELVKMLDKAASNSQIQIFALEHSDATDVTNAVNALFGRVYGRGQGGGNPQQGQPGQPQPIPGQPGQPGQGGGGAQRGAVVATSDTRTNSVIVVASEDNMKRVADLIQKLDDPAATALDTKIVKMQYADALDISDTINSILSNSTAPSSGNRNGGASFNQRVFGGGGFGGFGGGGGGGQAGSVTSTDPFAKVVANARTNALIVTATKERMEKIDELIRELDVPVAIESTTFVVPLKNAQAQDIAYILSQSFGTGQTNNNNFGFGGFSFGGNNSGSRTGQGTTNRQPINRRQGSSSTGGRAVRNTMSPSASIEGSQGLPGTLTADGQFVPDMSEQMSPSAQFFPGFGGFGGRGQQMQTPLYGRGSNGGYVNFSQLRQNVGVVADPATNSLVITTTPDNLPILKQIIDSLDVMPRQVMIEVIIAEASLDTTNKLGVQFDTQGVGKILGSPGIQNGNSNFPLSTSGSTATNIAGALNPGAQFGVTSLSGNYRALVQALATDNRVRILSTPKVFTSNNQVGLIDISTRVPYVSAASQNSFISTGTSISTEFLNVGINLQVTPRIARDGLVTIDVFAEASELLGFDTLTASVDANGRPQTVVAPRTSTRDTDTSVTVRDGEIVVLGGLMRDNKTVNVNKIPLLGDIPLIGNLFKSTSTTVSKTELMVFMIPHVVDSDAKNRALVDQQSILTRKNFPNLEKQEPALKPQTLPQVEDKKPNTSKPSNTKPADTKPGGQPNSPDRSGFDK